MTVTNTKGVFYLNKYLETLCKMMQKQYRLQSDFARENAFIIAEAASRGHISSVLSGLLQILGMSRQMALSS